MSKDQDELDDQDDQEPVDGIDAEGADAELPVGDDAADIAAEERRGRIIGWGISLAVHSLVLIGMFFFVFAAKAPIEKETPPVRVVAIDPPPPDKERDRLERKLENQVDLQIDAPETDKPSPVNKLDVPVEQAAAETDVENPVPKGREEAVGQSEMGGTGAFMAIGAGGGGSGMFGSRTGGGKKRAVGRGGGSKGSESAVDAALRWFKRHQSPDGCWDAQEYWKNCTDGAKCEPGKNHTSGNTTTAMTGYAVLCFLGAGYDARTPSKYRDSVRKGLQYLTQNQDPQTGALGKGARNYEHAIGTMALAEAYAMAPDPDLKARTQKAVDLILKRQNPESKAKDNTYSANSKIRLGWDYVNPAARNDSSVTGWNVMALKSAMAGGLNIGDGMTNAKIWLERHWKASNAQPEAGFKPWQEITAADQSRFAYVWNTGEEAVATEKNHKNLACVALVCGVFLGHTAGDPMIESLANFVMARQLPRAYPANTYYMYYNTLAIFQVGGDRWDRWNASVRDMLIRAQRNSEDCFDGSWDWEGTGFHGNDVGRVLSTAYNTLCLEVYYRYAQVRAQKH